MSAISKISKALEGLLDWWRLSMGAPSVLQRKGGQELPGVVKLGPADSLDDWATASDDAWQKVTFTNAGSGITAEWGGDFRRIGNMEFTAGTYLFSAPLKHIPQCSIVGNQPFIRDAIIIKADSGFTAGTPEALVEGVYRDGSNANSNFFTSIIGVTIDPDSNADWAIFLCASHGSRLHQIEIDQPSVGGIRVGANSDDIVASQVVIDPTTTIDFGWWFHDGLISFIGQALVIHRSDVGLSFGSCKSVVVSGYETENVALPIEVRLDGSPNWDTTAGDYDGVPSSVTIDGIRARRDSVSGDPLYLAKIQYLNNRAHTVRLIGTTEDAQNNNKAPFDRVLVENNGGTQYDFPLRWDLGYDKGSWDDFDFDFDLAVMLRNLRFRSDATKMQDSTLVVTDNPATATGATTDEIEALGGFYRLTLPSGNTYGTDYTLRVNDAPSGTALLSMAAWADSTAYKFGDVVVHGGSHYECISGHTSEALATVGVDDGAGDNEPGIGEDWEDVWQQSFIDRYFNHVSGVLERVVAGTTGTPSIKMYVRPWLPT